MVDAFRRHEPTLQGGFAVALLNGNAEASLGVPAPMASAPERSCQKSLRSRSPQPVRMDDTDYILGTAAVGDMGMVLVAMPLPKNSRRR